MWLAGFGVIVGGIGALAMTRSLRGALYGVTPGDPWVLGGLAVFLPAAVLAAAFFPARRAAQLDPSAALQSE
jgi:putative ABC transport system permease protein